MTPPRLLAAALAALILCVSAAALAQQPTVTPIDEDAEAAPAPAAGIFTEMTPEEQAAYAAALREVVGVIRGKVSERIADKVDAKQGSRMTQIATVLFLISLGGVLMLFAPLVLRSRYPGKGGVLFKYSALSALLFFVAVNLFAGTLLLMRGAQAATGKMTNPQVRIIEASFDLMDEKASDLAMVGPGLIEPTLRSLTGESDEPVLTIMLNNVQKMQNDLTVFASVGRLFKKISFVFGLLPVILVLLALVVFFQAARPTLVEILRLPMRAAEGASGAGRQALATTLRSVFAELEATLCIIGVIAVVTFVAGLLLSFVLIPALEIFIGYLVVCLTYVQSVPDASSGWVLFSLMGSIVFLVLNLAVVIVSSALFLSKAQKIFQRRFRDHVPLADHKRFWTWGTASLVWAQVLPLLYITVFVELIGWIVEKSFATESWPVILAGGPALFLVSFGLVFWLARGFKALAFLKRYPIVTRAARADTPRPESPFAHDVLTPVPPTR